MGEQRAPARPTRIIPTSPSPPPNGPLPAESAAPPTTPVGPLAGPMTSMPKLAVVPESPVLLGPVAAPENPPPASPAVPFAPRPGYLRPPGSTSVTSSPLPSAAPPPTAPSRSRAFYLLIGADLVLVALAVALVLGGQLERIWALLIAVLAILTGACLSILAVLLPAPQPDRMPANPTATSTPTSRVRVHLTRA